MLPRFLQSEYFPYASVEIVSAPVLRVVCGWCGVVLTEGEAPTPVSHGMCPGCVATFAVRTLLPALLLVLALAVPASAQSRFAWTPVLATAAGQSVDAISTVRFLSNGSGCVESNRLIGTHPATWTLVSQKAAVILGTALVVKVTGKSAVKPIRVIGQVFAYALGATGLHSGLRNASLCGL